jgi:hypothetical protein
MHPYFLDLGTSWRWMVSFTLLPLYLRGKSPFIHWIVGWVGPRFRLDDVEKRKFVTLPGLKLRPLGRPARSQSLYRLRYPGENTAYLMFCLNNIKLYKVIRNCNLADSVGKYFGQPFSENVWGILLQTHCTPWFLMIFLAALNDFFDFLSEWIYFYTFLLLETTWTDFILGFEFIEHQRPICINVKG